MWFVFLVTFLGGVGAAMLATTCIACGLFYAAELAEENSVAMGKILKWTVRVVIGLHCLLLLDGTLPRWSTLVGTACHMCYGLLLLDYPNIDLASPAAAFSAIALVVDHYVWLNVIADHKLLLPFLNLVGFFLIFLWIVPVGCFVSLSLNDLTLPLGIDAGASPSTTLFKHVWTAITSTFTAPRPSSARHSSHTKHY
ncbi:hypothetical protein CTAYLR_008164 [Chrysophaeum taylorii]|uniref:Uncharacterized protein n=1 Tax=Chrysophaeum taylorii TaxID=2483200 RepID=A0AAD7U9Y8_9STRA|nr:hypothetical protein CTAYLR_008164 [Chrysophaeum taylorii]